MKKKERVIDFVAEAEKIIYCYIRKNNRFKFDDDYGVSNHFASKKPTFIRKDKSIKSKFGDFVLNLIMAIGCLVLTMILMWGLLG